MVTLADRIHRLKGAWKRTKHQIHQGDRARDSGDFARAAMLYARALRKAPDNAPIHIQAGHMFKDSGDLAAAERHYLHAFALDPNASDVHLQLAHLYKNTGRPQHAYTHFLRLSELDPEAPRTDLENLRLTLRNAGHPVGASPNVPAPAEVAPRGLVEAQPVALSVPDGMRASGLIDAEWYRRRYPDIGGADPVQHYIDHGRFELRHPGPGFDPHWYLRNYPHVVASGLDPFAHYLGTGRALGLEPVGPTSYQRWIADHDTLDASDRKAIDAHILASKLTGPAVMLAVDAETEKGLARAIQTLRQQWLKPRVVYLCLADDCTPAARRTARALVGSDNSFCIVDSQHPIDDFAGDEHVVLIDAAIELREHALYMLVQAATDETALVYADHDQIDAAGVRHDPVFKPAASPELLRQVDYIGACGLLPVGILSGALGPSLISGEQTVASILRSAGLAAERSAIAHVPFVLYHDHANRDAPPSLPGPRLADDDLPTVTIIIPTRDGLEFLKPCIESLRRETDYPIDRIDIIVVDNGSVEDETIDWIATEEAAGHLRALHAAIPFNYPILNNMAAEISTADVLVLLNNDTEVQDPDWLRGLVGYVMQPDVGAVGPMLLYEDGTVQHAGVVLSVGGVAAHAHCGIAHDAPGALGLAQRTHEVAAVTGACLAMRREVFEEIGGLDTGLPIAFNDVVLCLAAVERGYRNLYVHDVWLRHYESKTRGRDDTIAKVKIFNREARYAREKFPDLFRSDPFYSPNLSFNLADMYEPAFPPRTVRPWHSYKRERQPPRALLLSSALGVNSEIGTTVALQARYLTDHGYEVVIGAPYSVLSSGMADGNYRMLENAHDAAAYAVSASFDVIVPHTPDYGEVSRWLGTYPPVALHYHGARSEVNAGVPGHVFQQEGRLLALPFVSRVIATSADAAIELSLPDTTIVPPGDDRLGLWSSHLLPLRDSVRQTRGWADRTIVLVSAPTGRIDGAARAELNALIAKFDTRSVGFVLLMQHERSADPLPPGMTSVAPANVTERQSLMVGADIFWAPGKGGASIESIEAGALGLLVFDSSAADPLNPARTLAIAAEAAGIPDPWVRRPTRQAGWTETLARFEAILSDLHGLEPAMIDRTGTMLSAETLIAESGLFDLEHYHARNADLVGLDAYRHFLEYGHSEGRSASWLFDTDWYLEQYPEVRGKAGGPMLDYLRHPQGLRDPNPFFSNRTYLEALGEPGTGDLAPLVHYLRHGAAAGLPVGDAFDADFYRTIYADVAKSASPALEHFLTTGLAEGRIATPPSMTSIDLFEDAAVERATGKSIAKCVPTPTAATAINGKSSATRFIITLLRTRADLRRRFPDAISAGPNGAFAAWLAGDGATELGLSKTAQRLIAAVLKSDPGERIRQLRLIRPDLAQQHPLALTPVGAGKLLAWALDGGLSDERISLDSLWWFLLSANERPAQGLVDTFRFTPVLQRLFPDGVTVFGRRALADWLAMSFGLTDDWADPARWPEPFTPAEQIRIAYNARLDWQAAHPAPFGTVTKAKALLRWLASSEADLAQDAKAWLDRQSSAELAETLAMPGLNMLGHFCYASGLRTSTESLVEGFRRADGNIAVRDVWVQERGDDNRHADYAGMEIYDTTIVHTQPEPLFDVAYERAGLAPRTPRTYRIGYWYWELDTIPAHWQKQADDVDEIWTATKFVGDALRERFSVPVRVIMPGLEHPHFEPLPRSHFGLPDGTFLFLFTFHMASIMERKNPLGLIAAFIAAFGDDETVGLVLKTSFGHLYPDQLAELRDASAGYNVIIIDDVYTQGEVLALMDACDSYISLHRSEGYGLTMAEAMLLGKPVIATGYSGNLDFMSDETSLLVRYDLVTLDRDYAPYRAGMRWAHASIPHAAECMRKVRDNPDWSRALGAKAKADLESRMSLEVSGRKMRERISEIQRLRGE
ncbi:glycosyltransferase [Sphingomonas sp. R86521]|uniref:glycosyltransferase n=1 Tax=Sphingomonas sp. R86521 TaxID=3093860 RepID=UPI0036D42179